jgi:hypothetical protein
MDQEMQFNKPRCYLVLHQDDENDMNGIVTNSSICKTVMVHINTFNTL